MFNRDSSEQFDLGGQLPELEPGMVYLDDNFNMLRFDAWEPKDLVATIHPMLDKARAEGQHIWDSTEHFQAYALGCWTAAARRTIAEALLVGVEDSVHYKGGYPSQVAELSHSFFLDAESWRDFATEVATKPDYRVGHEELAPKALWPMPPATQIAPQLMDGLQHVLGLGGAESKLVTDLYPHVEKEADGPHLKRFFEDYKATVDREQASLRSRLDYISQRWREGLDPNVEPGRSLYLDMVRCVEAYVALGAHKIMPATLDPRMRVAVRTQAPATKVAELPAFDVKDVLGSTASPQLAAFDPTALSGPKVERLPADSAPNAPVLPAFDPSQITGNKAFTEEQAEATELPTFDPSHLFGVSAVSGAGIVVESGGDDEEPPMLPVFDPKNL